MLMCPLQRESYALPLCFQFDSDDEREAAEAKVARQHKVKSQLDKKSRRNQARLPRTAGLRTLTELTDELTKAGLDPSRIQERAERIAKLHAVQRKRKREEDEDGMDMDGEDGEDGEDEGDWEDEGMDVDGEERPSKKKAKTVLGAIVTKRAPRSDRTLVGMRDEAVSLFSFSLLSICLIEHLSFSKLKRLPNYVILDSDLGICMPKLVRVIVLLESRW